MTIHQILPDCKRLYEIARNYRIDKEIARDYNESMVIERPPQNRLKEFRLRKELTQRELSNLTKIGENTISNAENRVREPSGITKNKIANALGIPVDEIFPAKDDNNA